MGKRFWLAFINLLGFLITIVVNTLAVVLPINNRSTGQLSDQYPNLFVPAGLTFSIWGIIYLLLAVYCVYELLPGVRHDPDEGDFIERIGPLFFLTSIFNVGWIFAWHYELVALSVVIMLAFLVTLIALYLRLGATRRGLSAKGKYLVLVPFSVYLGWISVAAIANITTLLVSWHWNGFGLDPQFWTVLVMVVAVGLVALMLLKRRDIFYALVVDWALLGILIKRLADSSQPDTYVVGAAVAGMIIVTAGVATRLITGKVY